METTASKMTIEHLGQDATIQDLDAFRTAVQRFMDQLNLSEQDATNYVWNNGDFYSRIAELTTSVEP